MRLPVSSEKVFTEILNFPSFSVKKSLKDDFINMLKMPVHFIYGENDWMEN